MYCASCGKELPAGAFYCQECGARVVDLAVPPALTSAPAPQTSEPYQWPEAKRRSSLGGRRGVVLTVILVLAVLLVGVSLEAGMLTGGSAAVNSPSDPLTGQQIYQSFAANSSQPGVSYTNKTVYIQDAIDSAVRIDSAGDYFSTVNSGSVVLVWSSQAPVSQLISGETILAKCWVAGPIRSTGGGYLVYLQNCDLIQALSQATTTSKTISVANL